MTDTALHKKTLTIPDDFNSAMVRPKDWNDKHIFSGGLHGYFLMRDTSIEDGASFQNIYSTFRELDLSQPPYNIDMTGTNDATSIINNAISSSPNGTRFSLPPGIVKVSAPILFDSKTGVSISGGFGGTFFRWYGDNVNPMFHFLGCSECQLSGFSIDITTDLNIAVSIDTKVSRISNGNRFNNIKIDGTGHTLNFGFITTTAGGGGNIRNDLMRFTECTVNNYVIAGWAFGHSSSRGNTLINCNFFGGSYGVAATSFSPTYTPNGIGGGFYCFGIGGGNNTTADFYIYATGENSIINAFLQNSRRLLVVDDPTNDHIAPVLLANIRWEDQSIDSDRYAIIYKEAGPLNIVNCVIGVPENGHNDVKVFVSTPATGTDGPEGAFISQGTYYQNTTNPFAGDNIAVSIGDSYGGLRGASGFTKLFIPVRSTANLPSAGATRDGRILIEDAGSGNRNLIIYGGGERFRIDGGSPF